MDAILLIGLLILVFVGIPVGIGLLFYFVPKRLGHPKTATERAAIAIVAAIKPL